jgi:hypothetical protein
MGRLTGTFRVLLSPSDLGRILTTPFSTREIACQLVSDT